MWRSTACCGRPAWLRPVVGATLAIACLAGCSGTQRNGKIALALIGEAASDCDELERAMSASWSGSLGSGDYFRDFSMASILRERKESGGLAAIETRLSLAQEPLRAASEDSRLHLLLDYYGEAKKLCALAQEPAGYSLMTYNQAASETRSQLTKLRAQLDIILPLSAEEKDQLLGPLEERVEAERKATAAKVAAKKKAEADAQAAQEAAEKAAANQRAVMLAEQREAERERRDQQLREAAAARAEAERQEAKQRPTVQAWHHGFEKAITPLKVLGNALHRVWIRDDVLQGKAADCAALKRAAAVEVKPSGDPELDAAVSQWLAANRRFGEACAKGDVVTSSEQEHAALEAWQVVAARLQSHGLQP